MLNILMRLSLMLIERAPLPIAFAARAIHWVEASPSPIIEAGQSNAVENELNEVDYRHNSV
jgi:hypothetical protein